MKTIKHYAFAMAIAATSSANAQINLHSTAFSTTRITAGVKTAGVNHALQSTGTHARSTSASAVNKTKSGASTTSSQARQTTNSEVSGTQEAKTGSIVNAHVNASSGNHLNTGESVHSTNKMENTAQGQTTQTAYQAKDKLPAAKLSAHSGTSISSTTNAK